MSSNLDVLLDKEGCWVSLLMYVTSRRDITDL